MTHLINRYRTIRFLKSLTFIISFFLIIDVSGQSYKYTSNNLNLRTGPSTAYQVLSTIPSGQKVFVTEDCKCEWVKVIYNGRAGYVSTAYLKTYRPSSVQTREITTREAPKGVRYYTNSFGEKVQSPTYYKAPPAGATALCRDGTYSFSRNRRGTCSHHGGVKQWLK